MPRHDNFLRNSPIKKEMRELLTEANSAYFRHNSKQNKIMQRIFTIGAFLCTINRLHYQLN